MSFLKWMNQWWVDRWMDVSLDEWEYKIRRMLTFTKQNTISLSFRVLVYVRSRYAEKYSMLITKILYIPIILFSTMCSLIPVILKLRQFHITFAL